MENRLASSPARLFREETGQDSARDVKREREDELQADCSTRTVRDNLDPAKAAASQTYKMKNACLTHGCGRSSALNSEWDSCDRLASTASARAQAA